MSTHPSKKRPKSDSRPIVLEMTRESLQPALDRAREVWTEEQSKQMVAAIDTLFEVAEIARRRGSKMARILRLFGIQPSERTKDLRARLRENGNGPDDGGDDGSHGEADRTSDDAGEPTDAASTPDPEKHPAGAEQKKKKNHGRLGADAYANAKLVPVSHASLAPGSPCPLCSTEEDEGPALYKLEDPAISIHVEGHSPFTSTRTECERLRCSSCGEVFSADPPEEAKGPKYASSVVAVLAGLHYGHGLPLNRIDSMQRNLGTPMPSSTQWEILLNAAQELWPLFDHLASLAAQDPTVVSDDTTARILEFMGNRRAKLEQAGKLERPDRTGIYTSGVVTENDEGRKIGLFRTGRQHSGENVDGLLDERSKELSPPTLVTDALKHNKPKRNTVDWGNCNAHARRHAVDEAENFLDEVLHILELHGKVFKNDRRCKKKGMSPEERLRYHQEHSSPVMEELRVYVQKLIDDKVAEPNSDFGKALAYFVNHWAELTLFLRKAGVPLTSNAAERALKRMIRYRKNSLFYRSQRGAMVGDFYTSFIFTSELNQENAFEYIEAIVEHAVEAVLAPEDWMPWNYRQALELLQGSRAGEEVAA